MLELRTLQISDIMSQITEANALYMKKFIAVKFLMRNLYSLIKWCNVTKRKQFCICIECFMKSFIEIKNAKRALTCDREHYVKEV